MLSISIERESRSPVYRQIIEQVRTQVGSGALTVGTSLPTVRDLATDLGISKLTVHKAYQELARLGIVHSKTRKGTVVSPIVEEDTGLDRLMAFSKSGSFPEFERISERTNVRSLASPVANPRLFDIDQYLACTHVLREKDNWPFYYPEGTSDLPLSQALSAFLRPYGLGFDPQSVVTLGGIAPAVTTVLPTLVPPGAKIAVQLPHVFHTTWRYNLHGYSAFGVPVGKDGLDTEALKSVCKLHKPEILYASPNFGFVDGVRWTQSNRREVAAILQRYGVKLLERTSLSVLSFDTERPPSVASMLPDDLSVMEFSFQVNLAAGLDLSFAVAKQPIRDQLLRGAIRSGHMLQKPSRLVWLEFIKNGSLQSNIERIVRRYMAQRDALCGSLQEHLPEGCSFHVPSGGYAVCVRLPKEIDGEALFSKALKKRVAVMPGRYMCTEGNGDDSVVLSYSMLRPSALQEAGTTFCRVLKSCL